VEELSPKKAAFPSASPSSSNTSLPLRMSPSSVDESEVVDGPGRKTVMAELPVTLPSRGRKHEQKPPQQKLDEFWRKFVTKAPGKGKTSPRFFVKP
jgi:hypothetical protein